MDTARALQALAVTPSSLAHLVAEIPEERLDREARGEWSARTVLAHLRDDEFLVMRMRLERMLSEETPLFPDFDEKAWAAGRARGRDRKEQILGDFALQRRASLAILEALEPAGWLRHGRHETYGEFSVASWVEHWAEHDAAHIVQVEAALGEQLDDVLRRRFAGRERHAPR